MHHLDALRAFAMLFVVFLHASWTVDHPLINFVPVMSHYFQRGLFFLVSGYFAAMMLQRYGAIGLIKNRYFQLGIPFITVMILMMPLSQWARINFSAESYQTIWDAMRIYYFEPNPIGGSLDWAQHLWYITNLMVFVATVPLLNILVQRLPAAAIRDQLYRIPDWVQPVVVAAIGICLLLAVQGFRTLVVPWTIGNVAWQKLAIYYPYFLLGLSLYFLPKVFENCHRLSWPLLALAVGLSFVNPPESMFGDVVEAVHWMSMNLAIIFLMLWIGGRYFNIRVPIITALTSSMFTVYLIHYGLVFAVAWGISGWPIADIPRFLLISAIGFAVPFLFHRMVVLRYPVVALLFNGRRLPQRQPGTALKANA